MVLYSLLALLSLGLASYRLWQSEDIPGLAAIELVLLALPWSLLLGVPPVAHAPLFANAVLVVFGVIINGALVVGLVRRAEGLWQSPSHRC
jgi:hypothetical protein